MYYVPYYLQWLEDTFVKYIATWMTGRMVYRKLKHIPKPIKPFCTLPYQTVEGLKICGKLLALCVITKCFITKCFITAF